MKKLVILTALMLMATLMIGCVGIGSTTISDVDSSKKGKAITADNSGFGILMLTTPGQKNLEGAALNELQAQCKGTVYNVASRMQVRNWMIVQYYYVEVSGTCVE